MLPINRGVETKGGYLPSQLAVGHGRVKREDELLKFSTEEEGRRLEVISRRVLMT